MPYFTVMHLLSIELYIYLTKPQNTAYTKEATFTWILKHMKSIKYALFPNFEISSL